MATLVFCDACGNRIDRESWTIGLKFDSFWCSSGGERVCRLCHSCGGQAARLLGFCHDTGTICSVARKETVDGASVAGPNGGGLEEIASAGVGYGHSVRWHAGQPDALPMAAMVREEAPWMRAQGYEETFWQHQAKELQEIAVRRMIADGKSDAEIGAWLWGKPLVGPGIGTTQRDAQIAGAAAYRAKLCAE